jgi:outer membrane porin, OprD family
MSTMLGASFHEKCRRGFFVFLALFFLLGTGQHLSWGQESVLDRGPEPDSVQGLQSPLDISFLPLAPIPWAFTAVRDRIRDSLKPQLETLPPFFRDTQLALNLRMYYFDRENHVEPPKSDNEAFTIGGSLAYQSGWLADTFRMGLEVFGSQKLYGPDSRDGTLLLRPGQKSYAVLGRAYGEFKYENYTATLFRQYIDTPYVNQQDNRMTPNTFEAYRITGKYDWVQFGGGYIAQIKPRNASAFTSMSEQAGAPPGRERGMITAGARFTPTKDLSFGAISGYVPDTWNIFYTEANYAMSLTEKLGLKLQAQFTEQDSVGGDNLIGVFNTRVGGAQASLSYNNLILRAAFSITANTQNINSPYGSYPGYLSLIEKDFDRAGEKAWLLGFSYDFKNYVKGLSTTFNFARGTDAVNPATKSGVPNENEWDITFDYRIQEGPLRGIWVRVRNAYVNFNSGGGHSNNVRVIINYPLPIL